MSQPVAGIREPDFRPEIDPVTQGESQTYRGASLIFGEHPEASDLADLFAAGIDLRRAKADWRHFENSEIKPKQQDLSEEKNQLKGVSELALKDPSLSLLRETMTRSLWDQRLAFLVAMGLINEFDVARASTIFGAYCEAKVWELALSSLAWSELKSRPTPSMLCEDYYAAHGFFTDPSCESQPSGKSYFSCVWKHGLMKTELFDQNYIGGFASRPQEIKEAKIRSWVDDGTLLLVLKGADGPALVQAAMAQERLRTSRILGRDYKDAFVPDHGTPVESPSLPLDEASPWMLISAMEDGSTPSTPMAISPFDLSRFDPETVKYLSELRVDLEGLSKRIAGSPSVSDYLFTSALESIEQPALYGATSQRPSLQAIFAAMTPEMESKISELEQQIDKSQLALSDAEAQGAKLFEVYTGRLNASAQAAVKSGVSDALWINSALKIQAHGSITILEFQLDESQNNGVRACWDRSLGAQVTCPDLENSQFGLVDDVTQAYHDPHSTALKLKVSLRDPEAIGFRLAPPSLDRVISDQFSEIDPEELRGKYLKLEIYPNTVNELPFYSGTLQIFDHSDTSGDAIYSGIVNLLAN